MVRSESRKRRTARLALQGAPLTLLLIFVPFSLSLALANRMPAAIACLVVGWLLATAAAYVAEPFWDELEGRRILVTCITSVVVALLCVLVGIYEFSLTASAQSSSETGTSTSQNGGQTAGTINNNGPIYNGPANDPAKLPAPLPSVNGNCNAIGGQNNTINCEQKTQRLSNPGLPTFLAVDNSIVKGFKISGVKIHGLMNFSEIKDSTLVDSDISDIEIDPQTKDGGFEIDKMFIGSVNIPPFCMSVPDEKWSKAYCFASDRQIKKNADGTFEQSQLFYIIPPFVPNFALVGMSGASMLGMDIEQDGVSAGYYIRTPRDPGYIAKRIERPMGKYTVKMHTTTDMPVPHFSTKLQ